MTRIWIVARWEFLATVARAGFIVTVLALPAVHLGLAWLLGSSIRTAAESAGQKPVAVVDRAGLLRDAPAGQDVIVRDEAEALRTLANGGFEAVFVLDDHYLETGGMQAFTMRASGLFGFADALARRERAAAVVSATGALGRDTQESAQIATTWILIGASPLFLLGSISARPSSTVAHVLSWIPLTSPMALLLRIGADGVSTFELVGALLTTIVFAGVTLAISAALLLRTSISGGSLQLGAFLARKTRSERSDKIRASQP